MLIIDHRIAGINFRTDSDVPITHLVEPVFTKFQVEGSRPDLPFTIRAINPDFLPLAPMDTITRERLLMTIGFPEQWLDRPLLRSSAIWNKVKACLDKPELAHINLRWNRAIIYNYSANELDFFYPPEEREIFLDPLIVAPHRGMFSVFMPNFSAIMLHGAGIVRKDAAVLFFAPDEGGKSSMIKLADGMLVLNDDQIILREQNRVIMAHGTPFGPISSGPIQSRLGAIFLLEKSSRFALSPLSTADAIEFIWNEHAHLWILMPRSLRIKAFELIADACRQARLYRMQFPKGYIDWNAIDDVLPA